MLWEEDPNSDYCYMFNTDALDWEDSREMCMTHGGDLASIITREEGFYINARIQSIGGPTLFNAFWIGANDRSSEGGWRWSDGGPFAYLNWGPDTIMFVPKSEPNDNKHNEDCGNIVYKSTEHTVTWNDGQCTNRLGYICKKLGLLSSTTRKPTPSPTPPCKYCKNKHGVWM
ncbi:hypothetical protein KUTeg_015152 [Tegillarca granosa]|uniref:C-type lectin domain-containing protein n=1 Tax=Tegillarca granosa TaxID=220873 RepID=A0ABQ9EPA9_TEGGR|nr:hypothetical protein KUTeg_015152 [Tegillarca granosa]